MPMYNLTIRSGTTADLTEYELQHLAEHLEDGEWGSELHDLLTMDAEKGGNFWYEVKAQSRDVDGYVADVKRGQLLA